MAKRGRPKGSIKKEPIATYMLQTNFEKQM